MTEPREPVHVTMRSPLRIVPPRHTMALTLCLGQTFGRRSAIVVSLDGVLAGGGVAYAAIQAFLGDDVEGVTCMTTWNDRALEGMDLDAAGPWLTGDAIADCSTLLAAEGLPPIDDPVVFKHDGQMFVTPTDQAPDWIEPIDTSAGPAVDVTVIELRQSLGDRVDGGHSTCRTLEEGVAWAQSELDRLELEDWTVEMLGEATAERPCTWISVAEAEDQDRTVVVAAGEDPAEIFGSPETGPAIDMLRSEIAEQCPTADQARAVADEALAVLGDPTPATTVVDESADCARVDITIGGLAQVTVYGPTTVS